MTTPEYELPRPQFPQHHNGQSVDSEDEGTLQNEIELDRYNTEERRNLIANNMEQSMSKENEMRLEDDLAMLQAERIVSRSRSRRGGGDLHRSASIARSRSRPEPIDQFDANTQPVHTKASTFKPPENPTNKFAKTFKKIHESSFLVRYFCYIVPIVVIILVPLLLGGLVFKRATVGGVRLLWFCVWLEIVWLTLWAGRILAQAMPAPVGLTTSLFTNNSKKWRDMCKQLQIPATLFFWAMAVLISFLPSMVHHHLEGGTKHRQWEIIMNKIIISIFVGACLNFAEKIIIQLIAIGFHSRTYADRIDINKFQIGSLTKLYEYSKEKINMEDSEFEEDEKAQGPGSGARTPMVMLEEAQKKTKTVFGKVGDVAGKVAGDFTGRQVTKSTHPRQLVLLLLASPQQSQILARRLYRTFVQDEAETITAEDLKHAFDSDEEAESAFAMFDKDLNGDISMTELEAVCVEIGKERRAITASLKDLDSVVAKLDAVLSFFVFIAFALVLVSLLSTSAAGVLTSAGSAVLALSWLLSQTAQEFLASCIFVLVKHPFDVGDRVTIYGNSGATGKGDDYFVKEISLLYTEFKKLEGQIVQAPNSYLNTLFILNMRRSGGLAEAVTLSVKFGTTIDQIDDLRSRLLEYVKVEKREYQPNILTEIRDIVEVYEVKLNVIFFYKSNWQNELLRLQRRNKFICAMMMIMQEVGIEGPRRKIPGSKDDNPFYYAQSHGPGSGTLFNDSGSGNSRSDQKAPIDPTEPSQEGGNFDRQRSILRSRHGGPRPRGESISAMSKRVDFSLGMKDVSSADLMDDLSDRREVKRSDLPQQDRRLTDAQDRISEEDEGRKSSVSKDKGRVSFDRSASRASGNRNRFGMKRSETESSKTTHRNRFFSRGRNNTENRDEEEGFIPQQQQPMDDIPEISPKGQSSYQGRDPRTGMVSSQAVRPSNDTFTSLQGPPVQPAVGGSMSQPPQIPFNDRMRSPQPSSVGPSQSQDFEMRRLA